MNVLFNPFEDDKKAIFTLAKALPKLVWLNHMPKTKFSHYQDSESETNIITDEMLKENCKIMQSKTLESEDWKLSIESVSLTHMNLSTMSGL